MSLGSEGGIPAVMNVTPTGAANSNCGGGWGGDWGAWIILFLIFGMFGWGGMGGFGGGIGGSHEEACGAVSGALMVLGIVFPYTEEGDLEAKRKVYALAKDFRRRFFDVFEHTRCGDLLKARPGLSERTQAARRLGLAAHCDIMIVTSVELLEELLREQGKL